MAVRARSYKPKLFDPDSTTPFRISRSKVDLFVECPRCCYLNLRIGVRRPSMPAFTLNIAVDHLLKKEFDTYREAKKKHPLMESYGIDAVPFQHEKLDTWRANFKGVERLHKKTGIVFFGAVDDIWVTPAGELLVVDYKATSKKDKIDLDIGWGPQYKRQMEFYQWLLRGNDLEVSNTGYFVYANGIKDREVFDKKLEFDIEVIEYTGSDSWIDDTVCALDACLRSNEIPPSGKRCEHCPYRENAGKALQTMYRAQQRLQKEKEKAGDKESTKQLF